MTQSVGIMDDLRLALGDVLDRAEALGAAGARGGAAPSHEAAALRVEAYVEAASTVLLLKKSATQPPTTQLARNARVALLVTLRMDAKAGPAEFGSRYGLDPSRGLVDPLAVTELVQGALNRRGRL